MAKPQRVLESTGRKPRSTLPTDAWVGSKIRMRRNTVRIT